VALPRVTQPEAARHLKALDAIYTDLSASVRRAVAAAPALPSAQSAARSIAMDARDIAAGAAPLRRPRGRPARVGTARAAGGGTLGC